MKNTVIEKLYNSYLSSSGICTDTRKLIKNSIYFALKGPNFDGNNYAKDAIAKGAKLSVVDDFSLKGKSNDIMYVEDVLGALQGLAIYHRGKLDIPVIGLTGSNGKTTTKNLMEKVLALKYKVAATRGNLNNHIGVPLTVLEIKDQHDIAIVEMGASAVGEIELLSKISRPTIGMITNISNAHVEGFENLEGVIRGKSELFDFLLKNGGKVIINNEDEIINNFSKRFKDPINLTGGGSIVNVQLIESVPNLKFKIKGDVFESSLFGDYNFQNILFALTIAKIFEIDLKQASNEVSKYFPENNRSEKIYEKSNCIILDAYNANPKSMSNAIKSINRFPNKNKVVILGDMNELGVEAKLEHQKIGTLTKQLEIEKCFFVGKNMKYAHQINKSSSWFLDRSSLEDEIVNHKIKKADILIKGSRSFELEMILPLVRRISA
ncbi:MAG: UDP-N-acetylmuramoyl-tripeptide--D-alanyl-D-alanine ligase [Rhodothermaeota bacterium MED-G19]|nr:MAG: UDP-N-acetylmuramoyl-tripeptide--D-alanyl-D-alanine ligase [Rhodothermaeota bacterium MED-G19]